MPHPVRQFDLSRVQRIWARTLEVHLGLYKGYVEQLNKLTENGRGDPDSFVRRFAFEHNGVVLHEHFFDALSGDAVPMQRTGALAGELKRASIAGYEPTKAPRFGVPVGMDPTRPPRREAS